MSIRITFDVSEEVYKKLTIIPHGMRKYVYRSLIEVLAEDLANDMVGTMYTIMSHRIRSQELLNRSKKLE